MKTKTELMLELWIEARTRFTNQLVDLKEIDLRKKLNPSKNSVGFLIRHIGEVELLFAKNVFGDESINVIARTVIDKQDTGEWVDFDALINYVADSFDQLKRIVDKQTESDWESIVMTKEFGIKTKAEAFGRIISHTTYHAGQMAIIVKYGGH
jgi:uncharacterized damage-inducible protein DinB